MNEAGELCAARTHSFTKHPVYSLERLRAIVLESSSFLRELRAELPFDYALVEAPAGKHVDPQLRYAVGCVQAAVPSTGALIAVSSWKLEGCGYGSMSKADVMRWARVHLGYAGDLQDEADACGIAMAARVRGRSPVVQEALPF